MREKIINNPGEYALGTAFITFATKQIADVVETNWSTVFDYSLKNISRLFSSSKFYTANRPSGQFKVAIKVDRAPNPNDIKWADLGVSMGVVLQRRVITFFITILLLGCSFGAILGLKVAQYKMTKDSNANDLSLSSVKFRVLSAAITLIIMAINFALGKVIRYLTFLERHWTETAFFQSLTIKIVVVSQILPVTIYQYQFDGGVHPFNHLQSNPSSLGQRYRHLT